MDTNPLKNFWQNTTPREKLGFALLPAILLVIIIISLIFLFTQPKAIDETDSHHINITNFDLTGAAKDYQTAMQTKLWATLQYSAVPADTVVDAAIREDSYFKTASGDYTKTEFLIDIPDLQQTFEVTFNWPTASKGIDASKDIDYEIYLACPNYTDAIYEGSICRISNDPYDSISQYLPYSGYINNRTEIYIEKQQYASTAEGETTNDGIEITPSATDGMDFLWVTINTCNDSGLLEAGKNFMQNWLRTRLVNPEDFLIEYSEICE